MSALAPATIRLSESHLIFPVWQAIRDTPDYERVDFARIAKSLAKSKSLSSSDTEELLRKLAADGLIIRSMKSKTAIYSLPPLEPTKKKRIWDIFQSHDCYCYECHGSGPVLSCVQCPRVFHAACVRPESDLDLPLFPFKEPVPQVVLNTFEQVYGYSHSKNNMETPPASPEKPYSRSMNHQMCVNCRLRAVNKYKLRDESNLNSLLEAAFNYMRSWISKDTFGEQESKSIHIPEKYVNMLSPVLFENRVTMSDISRKIYASEYKSLVEFQCDIMDVKHCIGVLRGVNCVEYEAAKYLLLDALHAIVEMSKCQDCYYHSSIKVDDEWFIKPCRTVHELVYAKQVGFSYWPAKVIRRSADGVDVRFFGPQHPRAVIPLRNVRSIGQNVSVKRSAKFTKAMNELTKHRQLLEEYDATRKSSEIKAEAKLTDVATKQSTNEAPTMENAAVHLQVKVEDFNPHKKVKLSANMHQDVLPKPSNDELPTQTVYTSINLNGIPGWNDLDETANNTQKTTQSTLDEPTTMHAQKSGPLITSAPKMAKVMHEANASSADAMINAENMGPNRFIEYMERSLSGCPRKYINIAVEVFNQYLTMAESTNDMPDITSKNEDDRE